ncbi:C40 family peptidase [Paraburkholderia sp. RL18-103-BIB-C]|uniref:C40 family peptidase n=1 Tax=Paraburkholderia sp. RL18-103-BIB-C TaxID=3031637 RepID=UPI0038BC841C
MTTDNTAASATDCDLAALVPFVCIHAQAEAPRECCGVIVREAFGALTYLACTNLAQRTEHFIIDGADYARAEDTGEVVAIVHSHVYEPPEPSLADRTGIERSKLPWLIVNHPLGTHRVIRPEGFSAPLLGRPFVHGVHDCYALVRDYYATQGVSLNDYPRSWGWWDDPQGPDLYRENFAIEGFVQIATGFDDARAKLREHDLILMQIRAPRENHMAVYLGNSVILHHLIGQTSRREVYQEFYQRRTTAVLRHRAFM